MPEISSYSTVALVPASSNVPLKNFAHELNSALNLISMDNQADNFVILWVCDNEFSEWTRQSILHADLILIVGKIDENSSPNQHLIILHRENLYKPPDNTASWLCDRGWISEYYHVLSTLNQIRCPSQKLGIPIDMVGGCSIGAFVGGLYATYQDSTYVVRRGSKFAEVLFIYNKGCQIHI
ncbi:hypothetical protein RF11_00311 [Thelohanellus kitauei]|uniref:Lysophospholipase NTE1-like P-loop domain-containing protein n=1 Tax=Thelohanellus kitauei TaxID=669202 RepID=A0A0C2MMY7_THEKT|nr:hypothetical protein RF11_00311 [Thelohanellus kitauei]